MIEPTLKDAFDNGYIIQVRHQSEFNAAAKPRTFSSPRQAYHFLKRLRTPYGYWRRLMRSLSIPPSQTLNKPFSNDADDNAAHLVGQYLCRGQLFIYELAESRTHTPIKERAFEERGGDVHAFSDSSVLLTSSSTETVSISNKAAAKALIEKLLKEDTNG